MRTDSTIDTRFGPELLAELRANLWAVDCQTCNRPLGRRRPSLTVAASDDGVAEAALHHRRCQRPRWESTDRFPHFGLHQSWRSGGFAVRGEGLVIVLVNPACEVATLVTTQTGWRLANLDAYLLAGMQSGWPEQSTPLPGLTGSLNGDTLTINFDLGPSMLGRWSTGALPDHITREIHQHNLVLVGVTTAVDVTTATTPDLVRSLVDRRQIAMAWANVTTTTAGTTPEPPTTDLTPAVLAATHGDASLLAALPSHDQLHAAVQVAAVIAGLTPHNRGNNQPDGVHIVIPDEPTGQHLATMSQPLLSTFKLTLTRLSEPAPPHRSDVVIGTPQQFTLHTGSPAREAELAILINIPPDTLPPDFSHHYQRILNTHR